MQLISQSNHSEAFKGRLVEIFVGVTREIVEANPSFIDLAELEETVERAVLAIAESGQSDPAKLARYASSHGKALIRRVQGRKRTALPIRQQS